jgi:hypothetical protein
MALTLNLEKSTKALVLNLQKAGIMTPPVLETAAFMDVSGSFDDEHKDGITDILLSRLTPWGLAFDPDKKMDVFTFSNGAASVHEVGAIDARNYSGFVQSRIINKVPGYNGGTAYSHLVERALKHFGWAGDTVKKAGFFGGLMGRKDQVVQGAKKRSLVLVITDGDNNETGDKERTLRVLQESEARGDKVYYLFLGISNQGSTFPFLEKLGDKFNNTGFVNIRDLRKFVELSDDELNNMLLSDELLKWFADGVQ